MTRQLMIATLALCFMVPAAAAQNVPGVIGFAGQLTDLAGNPVDAPDGMTIKVEVFHDSAGGAAFWVDEYSSVTVSSGVFTLFLGAGDNALPGEAFDGQRKYLALSINGEAELAPRLELVTVPYSFRAGVANTADFAQNAATADAIGGVPLADLALKTDLIGGDTTKLQGRVDQLEAQVELLTALIQNDGCIPECTSAETGCTPEGQLYTCGEAGDGDECLDRIVSSCPGQQLCEDGACKCASIGSQCFGDDVYLADSCGQQGQQVASCGEGLCNNGKCVGWALETPLRAAGINNLFTVGQHMFAVGDSGTVIHFDETNWTRMSTGTNKDLNDVAGFQMAGVKTLYVVGESGKVLKYVDGMGFETQITGVYQTLRAVFTPDQVNIIAVGDNGTVLRNNGTGWVPEVWEEGAPWAATRFRAVWAESTTKIFAGGDNGTIIHYNGESWVEQTTPHSGTVYDLFGISTTNVFAATSQDILRFTEGWTPMPSTSGDHRSVFLDVQVQPAQGAVVGNSGSVFVFDQLSLGFLPVNQPKEFFGTAELVGVRGGTGSPLGGRPWVVSRDGRFAFQDDIKWRFPSFPETVHTLFAVPGDPSLQFAAGSACLMLRFGASKWVDAPVSDGLCQNGDGSVTINAITGLGDGSNITAVGDNGLFKAWDGSAWLDTPGPSGSQNNNDIWMQDANNTMVVRSSETWLWNGFSWQPTGGGAGVAGAGTSTHDFHVVTGSNGTIHSFDGSEWFSQFVSNDILVDITDNGAGQLWAVGSGGAVFHNIGGFWTDISIPEDVLGDSDDATMLFSVWVSQAGVIHVGAGDSFTYSRSVDGTWTSDKTFPASDSHHAIWGTSETSILLGGKTTIFRSF